MLRKDGRIAGGVRLNLARSGGADRLPSECAALRIDAVAPDLVRPGALRAELGGMFVDAALLDPSESRALYRQAVALALGLSVAQLVMLAPRRQPTPIPSGGARHGVRAAASPRCRRCPGEPPLRRGDGLRARRPDRAEDQ